MTNDFPYMIREAEAGLRLDRLLAVRAGVGLRAARRMIEGGRVRVCGVVRQAAWKVRPGLIVEVAAPDITPSAQGQATPFLGTPVLIASADGYLAFSKPPGLHTAALAGGGGSSLEAMLPALWPEGALVLVNRLDRDTSGIVLAGEDEAAAARFRRFEDEGRVDKRYLALVEGVVEEAAVLRWALDTADRARTRVLAADSPDPLRWTRVRPVAAVVGRTLVEARIAKGARHQIRAHLARHDHPISGDALYGGAREGGLRLHHWRVSFPGFCAASLPGWDECKVEVELFAEENPCEE